MIPGTAWQPCASEGRPPRVPEHPGAAKRYQWKNDSASWAPDAPTDTQTGGGNLRLDEPGGWITASKVSRVGQKEHVGLPRGHGAQPGPDGEATGQRARRGHPSWVTSPWRSASGNPRMGQARTMIDP